VYHCSHPDGTAHAGSAILIKNNIKHTSLPPYQTDSFQATNIRLILNNIPTTISSIYCPPHSKINTADFNKYFSSLGNNFIAGGDFNSKHPSWGSRTTNTRGRALNNLIANKALKILSPQYQLTGPRITTDNLTFSTSLFLLCQITYPLPLKIQLTFPQITHLSF